MRRITSPRALTHLAVAQALASGATGLSEVMSMARVPQTTAYASLRALMGRGLVGRKLAANSATARATYWLTGSVEDVRREYEPKELVGENAGRFSISELERAWPAIARVTESV